MTLDFNKMLPWAGIKPVKIDGQDMVRIPKFYVKVDDARKGDAKGKKVWLISPVPKKGYHLHAAFMHNGKEVPCFYIGAYEGTKDASGKACSLPNLKPWGSNAPALIQACKARNVNGQDGWHAMNVYEHAAISMLMLVEYGTTNMQVAIDPGSTKLVNTGESKAIWRGIHEFWGNLWEYVDGIKSNAQSQIQIIDKNGNGDYKETSLINSSGWIKEVSRACGDGFDLCDVFIPCVYDGTESNGTFSDYAWGGANMILGQSGRYDQGTRSGAFTFHMGIGASYNSWDLGFRLCKY